MPGDFGNHLVRMMNLLIQSNDIFPKMFDAFAVVREIVNILGQIFDFFRVFVDGLDEDVSFQMEMHVVVEVFGQLLKIAGQFIRMCPTSRTRMVCFPQISFTDDVLLSLNRKKGLGSQADGGTP